MKREEQIRNAASEARAASAETLTTHGTQRYLDDIIGIDLSYDEIAESAFIKGAEWADANPAWRMCEEELPSRRNNKSYVSNKVCVAYQFLGGEVTVDYGWYDYDEDKWVIGTMNTKTIDIIAWLPLPTFNPESK